MQTFNQVEPVKSEDRIQQEAVKYFRNTYCLDINPNPGLILSVPLEACKAHWTKYANTGAIAGTSDLIGFKWCEVPRLTHWQPFFAETKTMEKKANGDWLKAQNPSQEAFEAKCKSMGIPYFVYRSEEEFCQVIKSL
ncbi:MAG: hypothetical protein ACHQ1D_00305 [Nitrososphaerales archaeon]